MGTVPVDVWGVSPGDGPPPPGAHLGSDPGPSVAGTRRHRPGKATMATTATMATMATGDREEGKESESPWLLLQPGCCYDDPNKAPAPFFWLSCAGPQPLC